MESEICKILDSEYCIKDNKTVLKMLCKTFSGKKTLKDTTSLPYMYILPRKQQKRSLENRLRSFSHEQIKIIKFETQKKDRNCLKIFTNIPSNIPLLKEIVGGWEEVKGKRESDIPFFKRYLIDNNIFPLKNYEISIASDQILEMKEVSEDVPLNFLAFDLETFNEEIIMASFFSKNFKKVITSKEFKNPPEFVEFAGSEREIIKRIFEIFNSEVDILFGYNTDGFDFPVLRKRLEDLSVEIDEEIDKNSITFQSRGRFSAAKVRGLVNLDLYQFFTFLIQAEMKSSTMSLHEVSLEFLKEGKEDMNWKEIMSSWRESKNLDKLSRYSLKDAELTYRLGMMFFPIIESLSHLIGLTPFEASRSTYGQLVENYLIRMAHNNNLLIPNKPKKSDIFERSSKTYSGGYVFEPEQGLFENLVMFDYRSLYPSILISHNISPETLDCKCCKNTIGDFPHHFCTNKQGFIPKVIESVMKERFMLKDKLKTLERDTEEYQKTNGRIMALKYILNSTYGYMGYPGARWYCRECAESITFLGRYYIKKTMKEAEKENLKVIYGDTDSILLQYDPEEKKKTLEFQKRINKELPGSMELELEDFYKSGIFTSTKEGRGAKKRYALLSESGRVKIKGFEQVRRDWSILAKNLQEKVIGLILHKNVKEAYNLIKKTIKDLQQNKIQLEDLRIYTKLVKHPKEYNTSAPHVLAAKKAINKGLSLQKGDTIQYIITKGHGKISDRAEVLEFAKNYDPVYYITHQILPSSLRIMRIFDYDEDDFLKEGKQTGLLSFSK